MRNLKLIISYDGTDFSGWAIQPELRTVQGQIEAGLAARLGGDVRVIVRPVDGIPAEASGKYRYVVSHVSAQSMLAQEARVT